MLSFPLQILLLIAIAFGQVFGGVSCCCLSRSLFPDWTSSGPASDADLAQSHTQKPSTRTAAAKTTSAKTTSKCPRCSSPKPATPNSIKNSKPISGIVCKTNRSGQCECTKYVAAAELSSCGKTFPQTSLDWSPLNELSSQSRVNPTRIQYRETSTSHLSGVSWQAYACIWTK
jgi:hypothetical protein